MSNDDILDDIKMCQAEVHKWGEANQVAFDLATESFHVLHRSRGAGQNFKIPDVSFDKALVMHDACRELAVEAGWRPKALLRSRKCHNKTEMIRLYRAQVLSFIESRTARVHFAAASNLSCIDNIQRRLLRKMEIT